MGGMVAGQSTRMAGTKLTNTMRSDAGARRADEARMIAVASELVDHLGKMKGAAMKLGQVLSTIDMPMLDKEARIAFKQRLAELQSSSPSVPFEKIEKMMERELGGKLSSVFNDFDTEAFAAASIGQVHRAVLDGREVAVKVQYPGIAEAVDTDMRNLSVLTPLLSRLAPGTDMRALMHELRERIGEELDYEIEAAQHRQIERLFRGHPSVIVPKVHTSASTQRILITDYIQGKRFDEVRGEDQATRDRFGETLFRFYYDVLYRARICCGDPHPGNYLLANDGRVAFFDFGMVRHLDTSYIQGEQALVRAVMHGDAVGVHSWMSRLGFLPDPASFEADLLLDQLQAAGSLFIDPGFRRLSPGIVGRMMEEGRSPLSPHFAQMRQENLPPEGLLIRRMEDLLISVLGQLEAGCDWGGVTREYIDDAEPATELGKLNAEFWKNK